MFNLYLKIIYRILTKYSKYTISNIFGLSIAGASIILLFIIISNELNYEKELKNHKNSYRINFQYSNNNLNEHTATTPIPLAKTLKKEYGNKLIAVGQLFNYQLPEHYLKTEFNQNYEANFYFSNTDFLRIADIKLISGSTKTYSQNNKVLISEAKASFYFPDGSAIGGMLLFEGEVPLEVIGIFKELPENTHFKIDFLASMPTTNLESTENWAWNPTWTYVQVPNEKIMNELVSYFPEIINQYYYEPEKNFISLNLSQIDDIHLQSNLQNELSTNSQKKYVIILILLAIAIFINAYINFGNLTVNSISKRRKEFFIKKVLGAYKKNTFQQILFESFIISSISLFFSFLLAEWFFPFIQKIVLKKQNFYDYIDFSFIFYSFLATFIVSLFIASLAYYSFSKTNPLEFKRLKWKKFTLAGKHARILIFLQYGLSVTFIIIALLNVKQLYFIVNANLGFSHENIYIVPIYNTEISENFEKFSKKLSEIEKVESFCGISDIPGISYKMEKFAIQNFGERKSMFFPNITIWGDFFKTFEIEILENNEIKSEHNKIFINEKFDNYIHQFSKESSIGKIIYNFERLNQVQAVVKNFHTNSLFHDVPPLALKHASTRELWKINYIALKITDENKESAISKISNLWQSFEKNKPAAFQPLKPILSSRYINEYKFTILFFTFSLISFLIAIIGIIGLTAFITEQKTREIAIHKVLGASLTNIIGLYFRELIGLLFIATILALPIAYFAMIFLLNVLVVNPSISWFLFLQGSILSLGISILVVIYYSYQAYNRQTLEAIKYE